MMNRRRFKGWLVFVLVVMISSIWLASTHAQTQAKGPDEESQLAQLFKKAREAKSPLAEAGFEIGDMILAINDQPVEGMESFVDLVGALRPKQKVSVLALDHRTGNTVTIEVVVR